MALSQSDSSRASTQIIGNISLWKGLQAVCGSDGHEMQTGDRDQKDDESKQNRTEIIRAGRALDRRRKNNIRLYERKFKVLREKSSSSRSYSDIQQGLQR